MIRFICVNCKKYKSDKPPLKKVNDRYICPFCNSGIRKINLVVNNRYSMNPEVRSQ